MASKKNDKFLKEVNDETVAIYEVTKALRSLGFDQRRRVLVYVCRLYMIDAAKLSGAVEGGGS